MFNGYRSIPERNPAPHGSEGVEEPPVSLHGPRVEVSDHDPAAADGREGEEVRCRGIIALDPVGPSPVPILCADNKPVITGTPDPARKGLHHVNRYIEVGSGFRGQGDRHIHVLPCIGSSQQDRGDELAAHGPVNGHRSSGQLPADLDRGKAVISQEIDRTAQGIERFCKRLHRPFLHAAVSRKNDRVAAEHAKRGQEAEAGTGIPEVQQGCFAVRDIPVTAVDDYPARGFLHVRPQCPERSSREVGIVSIQGIFYLRCPGRKGPGNERPVRVALGRGGGHCQVHVVDLLRRDDHGPTAIFR